MNQLQVARRLWLPAIRCFDIEQLLGIVLGLALGKPLGITGGAFGAVALKLGALPRRVKWRALHGL